jgi:tRNA G10  N-methylase Trm11
MYIAILGRQPALGIAELERVFGGKAITPLSPHAVRIDSENFEVQRLGGVLKAGKIVANMPRSDWHQVSQKIVQYYTNEWSSFEGKITLGISVYNFTVDAREVQKTGIILKQKLKKSGASLRLIPNPETALSTATSHHNKLGLSPNKVELIVVRTNDNKVVIAESTGSQNITAYAKRDQQRPKRDAFVGMLPPKLAQIMINLAIGEPAANTGTSTSISSERLRAGTDKGPDALSASGCRCSDKTEMQLPAAQPSRSAIVSNGTLEPEFELAPGPNSDTERSSAMKNDGRRGELNKLLTILDPFCGTGVILQEAVLMGYSAYGTDLSEKMISYSRDNLDWLAEGYHTKFDYKLSEGDAMKMNWQQPIDAVVGETYLGQPFSAPPSPAKLDEVVKNCNHIITEFLKNLAPQIEPGTPVCIAIPAWRDKNGHFTHLPLVATIARLGYRPHEFNNVSQNDLLYYRENQIVARELLVLTRA